LNREEGGSSEFVMLFFEIRKSRGSNWQIKIKRFSTQVKLYIKRYMCSKLVDEKVSHEATEQKT